MKAYCCVANILDAQSGYCQSLTHDEYFPESPYLVDHRIDIAWRKLDGFQETIYP